MRKNTFRARKLLGVLRKASKYRVVCTFVAFSLRFCRVIRGLSHDKLRTPQTAYVTSSNVIYLDLQINK